MAWKDLSRIRVHKVFLGSCQTRLETLTQFNSLSPRGGCGLQRVSKEDKELKQKKGKEKQEGEETKYQYGIRPGRGHVDRKWMLTFFFFLPCFTGTGNLAMQMLMSVFVRITHGPILSVEAGGRCIH